MGARDDAVSRDGLPGGELDARCAVLAHEDLARAFVVFDTRGGAPPAIIEHILNSRPKVLGFALGLDPVARLAHDRGSRSGRHRLNCAV